MTGKSRNLRRPGLDVLAGYQMLEILVVLAVLA